jgi:hypothetical protein
MGKRGSQQDLFDGVQDTTLEILANLLTGRHVLDLVNRAGCATKPGCAAKAR